MTTQAKPRPKLEMITTPQEPPAGVTFPRAMFDALECFPALLDRGRHVAPSLIPMNVIGHIQKVRELVQEHKEWANEHPDFDVPVSQELWELVKDWPALLERIRNTPGTPQMPLRLSGVEVEAIVKTRTLWPEVDE